MYKLSIILPVYKVEAYLEKCLDSVYSQINEQCQVVLVDDGSPDNCPAICDAYAEKYPENTIVLHQPNMGNGMAKNNGLDISSGEYVFFVDSDDSIAENALNEIFDAIEKCGADAYLIGYKSVSEDGETLSESFDPYPPRELLKVKENKSILLTSPGPWNKITKASLYKANGIYYTPGVWYEDIRTTVKILGLAETAYYIDKPLYNYLRRSGSIMNNANVEKNGEIIPAMDDLREFFHAKNLYETFKNEIDFLIVDHVLVSATVRVLRVAKPAHHLVGEFRDYTFEKCRDIKNNPYVATMPKNRRIILNLLLKKLYFAVMLIFRYIQK